MRTEYSTPRMSRHPDDVAVWPDGEWTWIGEIDRGGYSWKSDDYEIVDLDDIERLRELGIADELGL